MDIFEAILIFFGVVTVAVLFFGGWVIVAVVRLFVRAVSGSRLQVPQPPARFPPPSNRVICQHPNCHADNVPSARFCRRCGRPFAGRPAPVVRRVAMW